MSSVWLTCCTADEFPAVEQAIEQRDAGAQVLRLNALAELTRMFRSFAGGSACAAVVVDEPSPELERAVRSISLEGRVDDIVVVVRRGGEACVQRLLGAGATEVIDADGMLFEERVSRQSAHAGGVLQVDEPGDAGPSASVPFGSAARDPREAPLRTAFAAGSDVRTGLPADPGAERPVGASEPHGSGAPVIGVASGRGGCGKTVVAASLAWCSAMLGLRTALVDADLMFGNVAELLGVDAPIDLGLLVREGVDGVQDEDVERTAMRLGPGLTLWGPCAAPEAAELVADRIDALLGTLRREADVVVVDTSAAWGEATAAVVAGSDRCLFVCDDGAGSISAMRRAVELAVKLGLPKTRMVCVSNRCRSRDCDDDFALRLEMTAGLGSKLRVPDAGSEASQMLGLGGLDEVMRSQSPFARAMRSFARALLVELGCGSVLEYADAIDLHPRAPERKGRIGLPWKRGGVDGRS